MMVRSPARSSPEHLSLEPEAPSAASAAAAVSAMSLTEAVAAQAPLQGGQQAYAVDLDLGMAMLDTGCRTTVGGPKWHTAFQRELGKWGSHYFCEPQKEFFQFGPGEPMNVGPQVDVQGGRPRHGKGVAVLGGAHRVPGAHRPRCDDQLGGSPWTSRVAG